LFSLALCSWCKALGCVEVFSMWLHQARPFWASRERGDLAWPHWNGTKQSP
jgi:hypothetical protein